eukprot:TRINITY_DN906_c0_g2_i2.p1 TRINITY_DN906_c0_g2~~TRINITY_DN906_c0_g2_i2.p1  ORF type:complete len:200 (+),score=40.72 TRINITY_DN906_c0_g2_i2:32-601(+)
MATLLDSRLKEVTVRTKELEKELETAEKCLKEAQQHNEKMVVELKRITSENIQLKMKLEAKVRMCVYSSKRGRGQSEGTERTEGRRGREETGGNHLLCFSFFLSQENGNNNSSGNSSSSSSSSSGGGEGGGSTTSSKGSSKGENNGDKGTLMNGWAKGSLIVLSLAMFIAWMNPGSHNNWLPDRATPPS